MLTAAAGAGCSRSRGKPALTVFTRAGPWGEEIPETSNDHVNGGHDMGDMPDMDDADMPGMMTADEMEALMNSSDVEFQDMFLEMMKEHHEGAIEMAETELAQGESPDAIDLAASVVTTQQAEIDQIDQLLGS